MSTLAGWLPAGLPEFGLSYAAMLAVPGPSFAVVLSASLTGSRSAGILSSIGVASGAALLLFLALQASELLPQSDFVAEVGRVVCTLVLLTVGFRALRKALLPRIDKITASEPCGRHFLIGLVTAVTNPLTFAFFSSVALTARGAMDGGTMPSFLPASVFLMALSWFGLLAVLLSRPAVLSLVGRSSRQIEVVTGAILIVMAVSMTFV